MPRPDVAAATRYAAPRRRCRNAVCRAPTSLPRRGMPRPDVAAASRYAARPDVAAATRYAAPRRRCRVGITSESADGAASGFMRRLQYFSDTLTLVRIYRVAPGVRFQQGVDRNYGF